MTQPIEHPDQDLNARRMVPYALSDGSTVLVDASAAKGASVIDYTLKGGRIVQATKVSLQEAQDDAYSIPQAHIEAAQQLAQAISAALAWWQTNRTLAAAYDEHSPFVYGVAVKVTGSRAFAEEITQDVFVALWERPLSADPGWTVPILDVEDCIRRACRRWSVREIVCDPYRWARSYQILEDDGLPVVEYPQSPARMTPATQRFYEACVNRSIDHSGDPRLARHLDNAILKVDSRGSRVMKEHRNSPRKIDLAVAAIMGLDRAAQVQPHYDLLSSVW